MTTSYPYTFDSMSRIGNDTTTLDQRNIQNMNNINHHLENYYPDCPMTKAMNFALNQPNVFYNGSHEGGLKGCKIDDNNELKYTHITRPACKLTLTPRPFLTVPYLGKGTLDIDTEFQLRAGENALNKKSVNNTMELNFNDQKNYPMLPEMMETLNNTAYKIENDAMEGWTRGGMSAREFARSQDKKH
jgi:hypothetical protein